MPEPISVAFSVDALSPRLTGIGRYCLELGRGLRSAPEIKRISYFRGAHWLDHPEGLLEDDWQLPGSRLRRRFADWRGRVGARGALVHGPNYFLPAWAETGIVTVHDLSVLLYPETHPLERVKDFERRFQQTLDRASAIITDSETVRQEVVASLGVRPDRVFAVPLGIPQSPRDGSRHEAILARYGLVTEGYTLCVSTFEPRKRIDRLVDAYELLAPDLRRAFPLVLVGASGWRNDELNARIDAAEGAGWLKRLDFVPDATRDALYRGARLFVYPSLYEGFGLPPLEAMQQGIPTMIGDAATLIEVTRGAARVADVDDRKGFANDLSEALQDEAWRSGAAAAGRRVAEGYTWDACTARTIAVYQKVAAG
jgi:alpha-1,3-rhamnosyl/mannosyltransferase